MTAKEEIQKRQGIFLQKSRELAFERLVLTRRIEDIDKQLVLCETATTTNSLTLKDLDTEAAIATTKAAQITTEVKQNE